MPEGALQLIENTDRALVAQLLELREYIDIVVPRGGAELIRFVAENARMPVLTGGVGVCHTYVDAPPTSRRRSISPSTPRRATGRSATPWTPCSCTPTSPSLLPAIARRWSEKGVELRCDERALAVL